MEFLPRSDSCGSCPCLPLPATMQLYVNSYFTLLLEKIEEYGGDVIKFAGDALLVMWSQEDTVTEGGKEADPEAVLQQLSLQAAQCAIAGMSATLTTRSSR